MEKFPGVHGDRDIGSASVGEHVSRIFGRNCFRKLVVSLPNGLHGVVVKGKTAGIGLHGLRPQCHHHHGRSHRGLPGGPCGRIRHASGRDFEVYR